MGRSFLEHLLFDLMVQEFSDILLWMTSGEMCFSVLMYPFAPSNIDNPLWPLLISPMQRKTEKSLQRKNQRGGTWVFLSIAFFCFGGEDG